MCSNAICLMQALGSSRDSNTGLPVGLRTLGSFGSRGSISSGQEAESPPPLNFKPPNRSDSISSNIQLQKQQQQTQPGGNFLSNVSSELNGLAAQTTSMFSGFFGNYSTRQLTAVSYWYEICFYWQDRRINRMLHNRFDCITKTLSSVAKSASNHSVPSQEAMVS